MKTNTQKSPKKAPKNMRVRSQVRAGGTASWNGSSQGYFGPGPCICTG